MKRLSTVVAVAGVAFGLAASVDAAVASDRMLISNAAGVALFDNSILEVATAPESTLVFGGGPLPVPPAIAPVALAAAPGASVVVLTEPLVNGVPVLDPGEVPLVYTTPTGPVYVSDVVLSSLGVPGIVPQIMLLSDGDPNLPPVVQLLGSLPNALVLPETGQLQDLSRELGALVPTNPFGVITVQVQSDVPEPASLATLAIAAAGAFLKRRRQAA